MEPSTARYYYEQPAITHNLQAPYENLHVRSIILSLITLPVHVYGSVIL